MPKVRYSPELKRQALKDFLDTKDVVLVSKKLGIPAHAIYRFKREELTAPEVNKEKKIKELNSELAKKDLENKILRELLKKTYQVMPIELP